MCQKWSYFDQASRGTEIPQYDKHSTGNNKNGPDILTRTFIGLFPSDSDLVLVLCDGSLGSAYQLQMADESLSNFANVIMIIMG